VYGGATFFPPSTSITPAPITSVTPGHPLNRVEIFTVCPTRSFPTPLTTPLAVRDASTTEALDATVYIHPRSPSPQMAAPYRKYQIEHAIWGYAVEVGLHSVKLLLSGVFDRYPKLRVVIGHMGENIPYALYRLDYMAKHYPWDRPKLKLTPGEYFKRNFWITTSGVNWMPALELCIKVLGIDRVMWAIDYPYQETVDATQWLNDAPLSDEQKAMLFHKTAEKVFKIPPLKS